MCKKKAIIEIELIKYILFGSLILIILLNIVKISARMNRNNLDYIDNIKDAKMLIMRLNYDFNQNIEIKEINEKYLLYFVNSINGNYLVTKEYKLFYKDNVLKYGIKNLSDSRVTTNILSTKIKDFNIYKNGNLYKLKFKYKQFHIDRSFKINEK